MAGVESGQPRRKFLESVGLASVRAVAEVTGAPWDRAPSGRAALTGPPDTGPQGRPAPAGLAAPPSAGDATVEEGPAGQIRDGVPRLPGRVFDVFEDRLLVVDQRGLPTAARTATARSASELALMLEAGAAAPGPVVPQLVAHGLALSARRLRDALPITRRQTLDHAAARLIAAVGDVPGVCAVAEELASAWRGAPAAQAGSELADLILAAAQAIVAEVERSHAELLSTSLPLLDDIRPPLRIALVGDGGRIAAGGQGLAVELIRLLSASVPEGRVGVSVLEGRPDCRPARLSATELQELGIPTMVVPDVEIGRLISGDHLDLVLIAALGASPSGSMLAPAGGLSAAIVAQRYGVATVAIAGALSGVTDLELSSHDPGPRRHLEGGFDVVPSELIRLLLAPGRRVAGGQR